MGSRDGILAEMKQWRIKNAVLVTALLRGTDLPLIVSKQDVFDSARHDVQISETADGYSVTLAPAPKELAPGA